jgi:predicted nucleotidyltransferase component of viral defense system
LQQALYLQIVFTLPFADKLIFKGGTSLSKVGKHISRFSEDIDLAIARSQFGLEGDLTKKQIKKLRKESSIFVREDFYNALLSDMVLMQIENHVICTTYIR